MSLKTGVVAAENSDLRLQEKMISIFVFLCLIVVFYLFSGGIMDISQGRMLKSSLQRKVNPAASW